MHENRERHPLMREFKGDDSRREKFGDISRGSALYNRYNIGEVRWVVNWKMAGFQYKATGQSTHGRLPLLGHGLPSFIYVSDAYSIASEQRLAGMPFLSCTKPQRHKEEAVFSVGYP